MAEVRAARLCLHQTTSAAAGYRRSLEICQGGNQVCRTDSAYFASLFKRRNAAAKRLLSDLGLKAVSAAAYVVLPSRVRLAPKRSKI